jgi:hypothetical protein
MKAFNKHRVLAAVFPDSGNPGAGFAANPHATGSLIRQVILAILVLASLPCFGFTQSAEAPTVLTGEQVVDMVSPSVVLILVGEGGERASRQGSGVVVRPEGVLLTAYHVVKGASQVQVKLKNGEVFDKVELIATDERRDVAALRISAHGLRSLPAAGVDDAKAGEPIYVVSNPEGLGWTAASGILSAIRPADEIPGAGKGFRLFQFSAPVSPGSSGGALVDAQGRGLGIVIGSVTGQNLNFAVPVESVLGLADGTGRSSFAAGGELQPAKSVVEQPGNPPAQSTASPPAHDPFSLMRSVRTVYIEPGQDKDMPFSEVPTEPLSKKLFKEPEFKTGELLFVTDRGSADLVIQLSRKKWTWDFTYNLILPTSGLIVGSGKVVALDGTRAAPGLAKQIMKQVRMYRRGPAAPKEKK